MFGTGDDVMVGFTVGGMTVKDGNDVIAGIGVLTDLLNIQLASTNGIAKRRTRK